MKYTYYHEFLEISKLNHFTNAKIFKQGYVRKRFGGNYKEGKISIWCKGSCTCWRNRWTAVSEEGICYT